MLTFFLSTKLNTNYFYFSKTKELSILLQEKSDKVNQLSLENEQFERAVNEKDNINYHQSQALKELEKKVQLLAAQKEDLEKVFTLFEIDSVVHVVTFIV